MYHRAPSHFVIKIPKGVAPEAAAPMLCGGVTVYSPLKHFGAGPGKKVGVVGVGGLGHFAVLFAKALGSDEVVGISRKADKKDDAIKLGCDDYIATDDDADWEAKNAKRFDIIISTVSSPKVRNNIYAVMNRTSQTNNVRIDASPGIPGPPPPRRHARPGWRTRGHHPTERLCPDPLSAPDCRLAHRQPAGHL